MKKKFPELSNTDQCKTFYVIIRFSLEMLLCASAEALKYMFIQAYAALRPLIYFLFRNVNCQSRSQKLLYTWNIHRILAKPTQHTHTKGYIDARCVEFQG